MHETEHLTLPREEVRSFTSEPSQPVGPLVTTALDDAKRVVGALVALSKEELKSDLTSIGKQLGIIAFGIGGLFASFLSLSGALAAALVEAKVLSWAQALLFIGLTDLVVFAAVIQMARRKIGLVKLFPSESLKIISEAISWKLLIPRTSESH